MDTEKIKLIYSLGGGRKDVLKGSAARFPAPGHQQYESKHRAVPGGCDYRANFQSAKAGLGYLITYGSQTFAMTMVVTSIVILCIVSSRVLYPRLSPMRS